LGQVATLGLIKLPIVLLVLLQMALWLRAVLPQPAQAARQVAPLDQESALQNIAEVLAVVQHFLAVRAEVEEEDQPPPILVMASPAAPQLLELEREDRAAAEYVLSVEHRSPKLVALAATDIQTMPAAQAAPASSLVVMVQPVPAAGAAEHLAPSTRPAPTAAKAAWVLNILLPQVEQRVPAAAAAAGRAPARRYLAISSLGATAGMAEWAAAAAGPVARSILKATAPAMAGSAATAAMD
jgi:hypothetical protein